MVFRSWGSLASGYHWNRLGGIDPLKPIVMEQVVYGIFFRPRPKSAGRRTMCASGNLSRTKCSNSKRCSP